MADAAVHVLPEGIGPEQYDEFERDRLTPAIAEVSGQPADQVPEGDHTWFPVHTQFPE